MRALLLTLLLQLIFSVQAFYRLGTVDVGSISGTIYLMDSNTLFLASFSANESVVFRGGSGANEVTATTSGSLSGANMVLDGSSDWVNVSPIEIRTVSEDELIVSFDIPGNIQIPCNAEYLGKFSRNGANTYHSLAGHVFFDASNRRLFVAGLYLDGSAPAAYMWLTNNITPRYYGVKAGYNGGYGRVDDVNNQDTNVTYPIGNVNTEYRSLSVWCEAFTVSFGHVVIPIVSDSFPCSNSYGPATLGNTPASHGVSAKVHVLGPNTIGLENLYFDGSAPATWYWAGTTSDVHDGFIVPDHTGSITTLSALSNVNIVLTLPTNYDVCNTNFLGLYCTQASVSFGEVYFNSSYGCSNCPAICKTVTQLDIPTFQCQDLSSTDQMEYRYDPTNSLVTFKFHTCSLEANQYFAFGLSASSSGVSMAPNGDVVVCQYSTTGEVDCSDYDLTIRSQCALSGGSYNGACPDTVFTGGVNNYINTQVETVNGLTTFTTTRAVTTTDSHDRDITPGTPQYIIWARGGTFSSPTNDRWVLRHASSDRILASAPIQIDYDSTSTCSQSLQCQTTTPAPTTPWDILPLCIDYQNNQIQASIGNTGGRQGYEAITGRVGWGIAWYLNGLLIPEVYVLRGTTVTFLVNGGEDPTDSALYHPFYITNSSEGGINVLAEAGGYITETVLAGLDYNSITQTVSDLTVGPYCEWTETQGNGNNFNTFEDYKDTLQYSCSSSVASGSFEWTPDVATSNLVYYQCATHRLLGWKIHVVDSLSTCRELAGITTVPTTIPTSTTTNTPIVTTTTNTPTTTADITTIPTDITTNTPTVTTVTDTPTISTPMITVDTQTATTPATTTTPPSTTTNTPPSTTTNTPTATTTSTPTITVDTQAATTTTIPTDTKTTTTNTPTTTADITTIPTDITTNTPTVTTVTDTLTISTPMITVDIQTATTTTPPSTTTNTPPSTTTNTPTATTTSTPTITVDTQTATTPATTTTPPSTTTNTPPSTTTNTPTATTTSTPTITVDTQAATTTTIPTDTKTTTTNTQTVTTYPIDTTTQTAIEFTTTPIQSTPVITTSVSWVIPPICIDSTNNIINATIGETREGINVWYMNSIPIPEIYIERGTEVKFLVTGGNDPSDNENYHPLYLTSSAEGGILRLMREGKPLNQTVYAGLEVVGDMIVSITQGSTCRYDNNENGNKFQTFQEYQESLDYVCIGSIEVGQFSWTPDADTPDTIYYQCAEHENHGMKIRVVDELEECLLIFAASSSGSSIIAFFLLEIFGSVFILFFTI